MPESNVPFRTAPVTASDGIHETLVTEDSTRMFRLLRPHRLPVSCWVTCESRARRALGRGGRLPEVRGSAPPDPGTAHLVETYVTIWNGGSWGTGGSPCSSPTTT